jgi:hypothetical protein
MRRMLCLTLVGGASALWACSDPWQGEGEIIEHQYDDDDSYWVPRTESCSGSGLQTICTASGGYTQQVPERWLLVVEDAEGKPHTVTVSRATYDACPDGRHYVTRTGQCPTR